MEKYNRTKGMSLFTGTPGLRRKEALFPGVQRGHLCIRLVGSVSGEKNWGQVRETFLLLLFSQVLSP